MCWSKDIKFYVYICEAPSLSPQPTHYTSTMHFHLPAPLPLSIFYSSLLSIPSFFPPLPFLLPSYLSFPSFAFIRKLVPALSTYIYNYILYISTYVHMCTVRYGYMRCVWLYARHPAHTHTHTQHTHTTHTHNTHTHAHTHTHEHTHTHTHTHTYTQRFLTISFPGVLKVMLLQNLRGMDAFCLFSST